MIISTQAPDDFGVNDAGAAHVLWERDGAEVTLIIVPPAHD